MDKGHGTPDIIVESKYIRKQLLKEYILTIKIETWRECLHFMWYEAFKKKGESKCY
jgi:hypothetical protein